MHIYRFTAPDDLLVKNHAYLSYPSLIRRPHWPVTLNEAKISRPRPRPRPGPWGRGRGQSFEVKAEAEANFLTSRPRPRPKIKLWIKVSNDGWQHTGEFI